MSNKLPPVFDQLLDHLQANGGRIVVAYHGAEVDYGKWMVGYEFGKEEPDNPENDMVGGAAYGLGPDLDTAVTEVADQVGIS